MELTKAHSSIPARKTPFYINRNFALLWSGRAISVLGDFTFNTTLVLWVTSVIARGESWAPLATSGIFLTTGIPALLIGPLAGVFVDRWNSRRTMIWVDILRAILIGLLLLTANVLPLPWLHENNLPALGQLGIIYGVLLGCSICSQFFNSSRLALIGSLVPKTERSHATGLLIATQGTVSVIGPTLAALILFGFGVQWALILNALSFVVSFLTLMAIQLPEQEKIVRSEQPRQFWHEFREGLGFFAHNSGLITLLIAVLIATFGGVSLTTLGVYFVTNNLHIADKYFGLLDTMLGVGVIGGGLCVGAVTKRIGSARGFGWGMVAGGLALLVFARMTLLLPALILILVFGLFLSVVNSTVNTLLLHFTPEKLIGRIMSIFAPLEVLISILSTALVGLLVSTVLQGRVTTILGISFGSIDTIYTAGGCLFLLGGLYALVKLRTIEISPRKQA
jgi:MFS family permease